LMQHRFGTRLQSHAPDEYRWHQTALNGGQDMR
jgi:hypothetical protein